jgi:AcrR family transcriptional regulator
MSGVVKTNSAKQVRLSSRSKSPRKRADREESRDPASPDREEDSRICAVQRMRVLAAVADVACERGFEATTVTGVVRRAKVSRRTFYDLFQDRNEAFLAAFEDGVRRAENRVLPAYAAETGWVASVRAGLVTLLAFFDEEPQLAKLCVVQSLAAGPVVLERRAELLARITRTVDGQARDSLRGSGPPDLTAEGIVGGVLAILHARLSEKHPGPLVELEGPLMGMIVLPYLGTQAARRELSRLTLKPAGVNGRSSRGAIRPLEGLQMRLTYRTLRVLAAIATHPGASNRDIADGAGVKDQGQISKLLTRLEKLGLIQNGGIGQPRGEPNAWTLTPRGHAIQNATTTQT